METMLSKLSYASLKLPKCLLIQMKLAQKEFLSTPNLCLTVVWEIVLRLVLINTGVVLCKGV